VEQDAALLLLQLMQRWEREPNVVPDWAYSTGLWMGQPIWHSRLVRLIRWRLADQYGVRSYAQHKTLDDLIDAKLMDAEERAEQTDEQQWTAEEVRNALDQLSDKQRFVVQALVFEGKRQQDVAKEMGVSQVSVCRLYERAKIRLEVLLSKLNPLVKAALA